jgi:hypothetical protein
MLRLSVKFNNTTGKKLANIEKQLRKLPAEAADVFKQNTPVKTGNAKSKTSLRGQDSIVADYPYAQKLDDGYSKQAPQGMTKPTKRFIKQRINQIVKGL